MALCFLSSILEFVMTVGRWQLEYRWWESFLQPQDSCWSWEGWCNYLDGIQWMLTACCCPPKNGTHFLSQSSMTESHRNWEAIETHWSGTSEQNIFAIVSGRSQSSNSDPCSPTAALFRISSSCSAVPLFPAQWHFYRRPSRQLRCYQSRSEISSPTLKHQMALKLSKHGRVPKLYFCDHLRNITFMRI